MAGTGGMPPGLPMPVDLSAVEAATIHVDVGSDLRFSAKVICKNDEIAEGIEKSVTAMLTLAGQSPDVPPEARELLDSIDVSRSGSTIRAEVTIKEELLNKAIEQAKQEGLAL